LTRRLFAVLAVGVLAVFASGCSLFMPHNQPVSVRADRPDAELYVDGEFIGTGSAVAWVQRNRSHDFHATWNGHSTRRMTGYVPSVTGVLDLVGTFFFIVPIIGIISPGFFSVDADVIVLPFYEAQSANTAR
jgi:hypothetical protein